MLSDMLDFLNTVSVSVDLNELLLWEDAFSYCTVAHQKAGIGNIHIQNLIVICV